MGRSITEKKYLAIRRQMSKWLKREIMSVYGIGEKRYRLIRNSRGYEDYLRMVKAETKKRAWRANGSMQKKMEKLGLLSSPEGEQAPERPSRLLHVIAGLVVLGIVALAILANWVWYKQ